MAEPTPTPPLVDVIEAAIYKARWVDSFGKETVLATDEAIARAVLDALEQAEQAARYEETAASMTPEQVSATMERVRARRQTA